MKIISTSEINSRIEKLIRESNEYLIFLSPYLKINNNLLSLIKSKVNQLSSCSFVCRKKDINPESKKELEKLSKIEIINWPNLHAKCYISETEIIMCSMNLYEYSQVNNFEIGIIMNHENDKLLVRELFEEIGLYYTGDHTSQFNKIVKSKLIYNFSELRDQILKTYRIPVNYNLNGDDKSWFLVKFSGFEIKSS